MEYTGIVMNYGIGAKKQYAKRMIIMVPGTKPYEAKGLVWGKGRMAFRKANYLR